MSATALRIVEGSSMDKTKALSAALSQIERQFGKGSVMKLGKSDRSMDIETISSGSLGTRSRSPARRRGQRRERVVRCAWRCPAGGDDGRLDEARGEGLARGAPGPCQRRSAAILNRDGGFGNHRRRKPTKHNATRRSMFARRRCLYPSPEISRPVSVRPRRQRFNGARINLSEVGERGRCRQGGRLGHQTPIEWRICEIICSSAWVKTPP